MTLLQFDKEVETEFKFKHKKDNLKKLNQTAKEAKQAKEIKQNKTCKFK